AARPTRSSVAGLRTSNSRPPEAGRSCPPMRSGAGSVVIGDTGGLSVRGRSRAGRQNRWAAGYTIVHKTGRRNTFVETLPSVLSRHMSSDVRFESTRRRLNGQQAETVDRLTGAAVEVLREKGAGGLAVRAVASRAGVAPATAYTYFSSKGHLIAEVFWRRLGDHTPEPSNGGST